MKRISYQVGSGKVAISQGDITKFRGDAIVNAANERCLGGGGVDGAIHRAAGDGLYEACLKLKKVEKGVRCPTGQAVLTPGFHLPARWVIHTVGPNLSGRDDVGRAATDDSLLESAYRSSLELANKEKFKSVAFPAISCGVFAYPVKEAATKAMKTTKEYIGNLSLVEFVMFDEEKFLEFKSAADEIFEQDAKEDDEL